MYCYLCGTYNTDEAEQCHQCDANLRPYINAMSDGNAEIARLKRFIPEIVAEGILNDTELLRSQKREVAVMFVDAVGFTHLSTSLDAETTFLLINDLLSRLVSAVHRYGGMVDKFTGDGLMAIFGAPKAHENDAELAVRAALDMQVAAAEFSQVAKAQLGSAVQIRIGIHLGPAVAGLLGTEEQVAYTVIGETVNMASRIESLAIPGHILVSERVKVATSRSFEFDEGMSASVKGIDHAVTVYEVKRDLGTLVTRGVQGTSPVYIGRDIELTALKTLTERFHDTHKGHVVLVIGEAGMGKSRLVREWIQTMDNDVVIWQGRALPYAQGGGYGVFRSLLAYTLSTAAFMQGWQERIAPAFHPYIRQLLNIPLTASDRIILRNLSPERLNQLTVLSLREWIMVAAQTQPIVIMLDDYHWADDVSRNALQTLITLTQAYPILFCIMSRPQPEIELDLSTLDADQQSRVELDYLSLTDSRAILGHLIAIDEFPESFKANILTHCGGNPFYIEEIVRMLIEKEIVQLRDGLWHNNQNYNLEEVEIPVSLQALMLTRVDRLPANLRNLLEDAAVIGPEFTAELLSEVEYRLRRLDNIEPMLERLIDMGLLMQQQDMAEKTYAFRHIFTQEAIYGSILRNRRPQLHRTIAEAVESLCSDNLDAYAEILAYHYDQARVRANALQYMLISGDHARSRFANREAMEYYSRSLQLSQHLSQTEDVRWRAAVGLGDIQQHVGEYEEALTIYEAVIEEHRIAPPARKAELMLRLGRVWDKRGNHQESERWLSAALGQLAATPEKLPALEAEIHAAIGWLSFRSGNAVDGESSLLYALNLVENSDNLEVQATILNRLGGTYYAQGQQERAVEAVQRSLDIREQLNDLFGIARSSNNLGVLMQETGDLLRALDYFKRSLQAMTQIGDTEGKVIALNNIGNVHIDMGDWELAEQNLQNGLLIAREIANPHRQAEAHLILGRLYYHWQRYVDAAHHLNATAEQIEISGAKTHPLLISSYTLLGMVSIAEQCPERADEWKQKAEEQLRTITNKLSANTIEQGLYEQLLGLLALTGQHTEEAITHFRKSMAIYKVSHSAIELGRSMVWCGMALAAQNDDISARQEWESAREIFQKGHASAEMIRVDTLLA